MASGAVKDRKGFPLVVVATVAFAHGEQSAFRVSFFRLALPVAFFARLFAMSLGAVGENTAMHGRFIYFRRRAKIVNKSRNNFLVTLYTP